MLTEVKLSQASLKKVDVYGGVSPRDIANYTIPEVARTVRVSGSTISSWFLGQSGSKPVLRIADSRRHLLSFTNLVEAQVLAALRRHHGFSLFEARKTVSFLRTECNDSHPLANQDLLTDGSGIFIDKLGKLIDASQEGQLAIRDILQPFLSRIERDPTRAPVRFYPFVTASVTRSERIVAIDPRVQFGKPMIASCGAPTKVIADRMLAGDSISDLVYDYGCQPGEIEEAIRYELSRRAA